MGREAPASATQVVQQEVATRLNAASGQLKKLRQPPLQLLIYLLQPKQDSHSAREQEVWRRRSSAAASAQLVSEKP